MSNSYSYTTELEQLIMHTLLPVYERHCLEHNIKEMYKDINPELLRQLRRKKQVAALFRPKEI